MKKIFIFLLVCVCFLATNIKSSANDISNYIPHKIIVKFQDDFSTNNPPKTFSVALNETKVIDNVRTVEEGAILYLETTKVSKEKRGKINASVQARIIKAYIPSQDTTIDVNEINSNAYVKLSKYEKLDKLDKALDVGISATNFFIKNITYPAHLVKGLVKNETGNRLQSGAKEVFDNSALSYAKLGEAFEVKSGDLATLTYYTKDISAQSIIRETKEEAKQ